MNWWVNSLPLKEDLIPQQDKWQPILNTVANVQRYRWLKHSVPGVFSQSSLMGTIVEFALKEEPLDVEKMRKCLLKQVRLNGTSFSVLINHNVMTDQKG